MPYYSIAYNYKNLGTRNLTTIKTGGYLQKNEPALHPQSLLLSYLN
jgi:hypothetical protein